MSAQESFDGQDLWRLFNEFASSPDVQMHQYEGKLLTESVQACCLEELRRVHYGRLGCSLGEIFDAGYDSATLDCIWGSMALLSIEQGNEEAAYSFAMRLADLPDTGLLVDVCFVADGLNIPGALEPLHKALNTERELAMEPTDPDEPDGELYSSDLLMDTINHCINAKTAPDTWIQRYSSTPEQAWQLMAYAYSELAKVHPQEPYFSKVLDKILLRLTTQNVNTQIAYNNMSEALQLARGDRTSIRLIERFLAIKDAVTPNSQNFEKLVDVGVVISQDPSIARRFLDVFHKDITNKAQALVANEVDPLEVNLQQIRWQLAHAVCRGEELGTTVGAKTAEARELTRGYAVLYEAGELEELVNDSWDDILGEYAEQCAARGDFRAAKLFIEYINSTVNRRVTFGNCLKSAQSLPDLHAFTPDPMLFWYDNQLEPTFEVAQLLLTKDPARLSTFARNIAGQANNDEGKYIYELLAEAAEAVHDLDSSMAADLARNLLRQLRAGGAAYDKLLSLSEILLWEGDGQEAELAYQDIARVSDIPDRLSYLANLAYKLQASISDQ